MEVLPGTRSLVGRGQAAARYSYRVGAASAGGGTCRTPALHLCSRRGVFCLFSLLRRPRRAGQFQLLNSARVKHQAYVPELTLASLAWELRLDCWLVASRERDPTPASGEKSMSMGCRTLTPSVLRECGTLYGEAIADAIFWPVNVQRGVWERRDGANRHKQHQ